MNYLYVANWKMNLTLHESFSFCEKNQDALKKLTENNASIVICPTVIALAPIAGLFQNSPIALGAQDCSAYDLGAYTGETSARSLAEVGVTYCIVGHSERRMHFDESAERIIEKVELLIENCIQPIICIGETQEHFEEKQAFVVLTQQLEPIITTLAQNAQIIVAYEPVWAIGTGIVPETAYLTEVFTWLAELFKLQLPNATVQLLYGGGINTKNIKQLKSIPLINGFLIGSASTNIAEFAEIIKSP